MKNKIKFFITKVLLYHGKFFITKVIKFIKKFNKIFITLNHFQSFLVTFTSLFKFHILPKNKYKGKNSFFH